MSPNLASKQQDLSINSSKLISLVQSLTGQVKHSSFSLKYRTEKVSHSLQKKCAYNLPSDLMILHSSAHSVKQSQYFHVFLENS